MENKEIIDGNKLIAEFMGLKDVMSFREQIGNGFCSPVDMKYHTSWDWLMIVVEKIESLGYYTNILSADNNNKSHTMHITRINEQEQYSLWHDSKIHAVYYAVVEFIKWYNENKENGK